MMDRYEPAQYPLQFGDVVLFKNAEGIAVHACNHIAGDIVFTKNGRSPSSPWVFQHIKDVYYGYQGATKMSLEYVRLRPQYRQ